ncbi:unnamed protein product [Clonostachys byssicola]|uniref:NACHT domain-containing protein n=1 Tax=Clonostachys byssicola TaxID=160290 RepID=A0A9N9UHE5_9HYPO|nr:unnamed protein product [Clonostachys byssicola]
MGFLPSSRPLELRGRHHEDLPLHAKIRDLFSNAPTNDHVKVHFVEKIWPEIESGYALLMREMREYCTRHVKVPHTVTGRVKSRESIEESIARREEYRITHGKGLYVTLHEILDDMHDLTGIRITVDFLSDTEPANEFIRRTFQQTKDSNIFPRHRSVGKDWKALFGAYESTNHHVTVRSDLPDISHKFDNVCFEIQVTCLAESLYNKLAHPLLYKENYGRISRKEEMVIDLSHGIALCFSICHLLMQDKLEDQAKSIDEPGLRDAIIWASDDPESEPSHEAMDALAKLTPEVISEKAQENNGFTLSESPKDVNSNGDLWTSFVEKIENYDLGFAEVKMAIENQTETLRQFQLDERDKQCLCDLLVINPEDHKALIERTKGGLLEDAYRWILRHETYCRFRRDQERRLLWIKGDPAKGKTMLLCGIIDELKKETTQPIAYFFCQATQEQNQRSAPTVLRSLIWLLCQQRPELVLYIRESYSVQGKKLFEGPYALSALEKFLRVMLCDPVLASAVFVIDALDECSDGDRRDIIRLIIELSGIFDVKWLFSSRNCPDIEDQFRNDCSDIEVSLELNKAPISTAVKYFIEKKVDHLEQIKRYDPKLKQNIFETLQYKASDTFLWVALVCEELARPETRRYYTMQKLREMPQELSDLYERMIEQIFASKHGNILKQILATACTSFRPLAINELYTLVTELKEVGIRLKDFGVVVKDCGSFLTTHERTVYFVHQTAQDFLVKSMRILTDGIPHQHLHMFKRSLAVLKGLDKNIYNLENPGALIEEITVPRLDPLAGLEYPCVFWVDHLEKVPNWCTRTGQEIEVFFRGQLLSWLEAASLLKKVPEAVRAVKKLKSIIGEQRNQSLNDLAEDSQRLVFSFQQVIEMAPLQVYGSALVFSPMSSFVRQNYQEEEITRVKISSGLPIAWDAVCAHTLQGHMGTINTVAFSHDGCEIASSSYDATVRIWDTSSGQCVQKLSFSPRAVGMSFSHDKQLLAIASEYVNHPIKIWELRAQEFAQDIIINGEKSTRWVQFSPQRNELLIFLDEGVTQSVEVWDLSTSSCVRTINTSWSTDGRKLASTPSADYQEVTVWNLNTGNRLLEFEDRHPASFSATDPSLLALRFKDNKENKIEVRSTETGECIHRFPIDDLITYGLLCLGSTFLASAGYRSQRIKIWTFAGACTQTLSGHSKRISDLAYSPSKRLLASASEDRTVRLWDMSMDKPIAQETEDRQALVSSLNFSNNQRWLASAAIEKASDGGNCFSVKIWDVATQICIHTMSGSGNLGRADLIHLFFSQDDRWFACTTESTLKIWDTSNWGWILNIKNRYILDFSFSSNGCYAAILEEVFLESLFSRIRVWDLHAKARSYTINLDEINTRLLEFSGNGEWIAVAFSDKLRIYSLKSPAMMLSANISDIQVLQAASCTDLRFSTNIGTVYKEGDDDLQINSSDTWHSKTFNNYSISEDSEWVFKGDERILWISPDYRSSIAVTSSLLAMSSPSGGIVWGKLP